MSKRSINVPLLVVLVTGLTALNGLEVKADTIYVKADGTGDYPTIQAAIDAATDGDEVVLAPGTYTGDGNRDLDFANGLPEGQTRAITVRSTEPQNPGIVSATIINCEGTEIEPHRGFYFYSGEGLDSVVAGLTITGGFAPMVAFDGGDSSIDGEASGGAILCEEASPTITRCRIYSNHTADFPSGDPYDWYVGAGLGGGISCKDSNSVISRCTIEDNRAGCYPVDWDLNGPPYGLGGGIYCGGGSPVISNCVIKNNIAQGISVFGPFFGYNGHGRGGGIYIGASNITVRHCLIEGNLGTGTNTNWGDGGYGSGGGISCYSATATIENCVIRANSCRTPIDYPAWGGGLEFERSTVNINDCTITDNFVMAGSGWTEGGRGLGGAIYSFESCCQINDSIIAGNTAGGYDFYDSGWGDIFHFYYDGDGGGIYCEPLIIPYPGIDFVTDCMNISNCTIVGNAAMNGVGGAIYAKEFDPIITNTIIWDNRPDVFYTESAAPQVTFSDVQGRYGGAGNIEQDPDFVIPSYWDDNETPLNLHDDSYVGSDYHLCRTSQCINAGDPTFIPETGEKDIDGDPRVLSGCVDIGADEYSCQGPCLSVSPTKLEMVGFANASELIIKTVEVRNCGIDTLHWETISDSNWLSTDPSGGQVEAEKVEISVMADVNGLALGDYTGLLTIRDTQAPENEKTVLVRLKVVNLRSVPEEYDTIQDAIDAGEDWDVVQVSDGVYTGVGNRSIDFKGKAITVRSENGPQSCIIDCEGLDRGFYFGNAEGPYSVLDGFTITNGAAGRGAGILIDDECSPQILNCTIKNNHASGRGGAIFCGQESQTAIRNCRISRNTAKRGGGICVSQETDESPPYANVKVIDCKISANTADYYGGGICCYWNASITLKGCRISNNVSNNDGGALYCGQNASAEIINCEITGNRQTSGMFYQPAAIYCDRYEHADKLSIDKSTIADNSDMAVACRTDYEVTITNSTFSNNGLILASCGPSTIENCMFLESHVDCSVREPSTITSCTFIGKGIGCMMDRVTVTNCIIAHNTTDAIVDFTSGFKIRNCFFGGNLAADYAGSHRCKGAEQINALDGMTGNLDGDPMLTFDGHLREGSPCINAGDPNYTGGPYDIDGDPRLVDGRVDIGADEYIGPAVFLSVSPLDMEFFGAAPGVNPDDQVLQIHNPGSEILEWEIESDSPWLSVDKDNGRIRGGTEDVRVMIDVIGLDSGSYSGLLIVRNAQSPTDEKKVWVDLHVGHLLSVPDEYETIQAAIDASNEWDVVMVADGTYTGQGNVNVSFRGKAITVRSESGPAGCVIDCEYQSQGFVFSSGEDRYSVLDGFTIVNGFANKGGGIRIGFNPRILNCIIKNNVASEFGGGIFCGGSPTIENCSIINNTTYQRGGGIYCFGESAEFEISDSVISNNTSWEYGGGISCCYQGSLIVDNCTFRQNSAGIRGGGIYCEGSSFLIVTNSLIAENSAGIYGGGIGGYQAWWLEISNCSIINNEASSGGGIRIYGSGSCSAPGCVADYIRDCIIVGNRAYSTDFPSGGGISYFCGNIINCTIAENRSASGGGGLHHCLGEIYNCIIWGNYPNQFDSSFPTYSCIQDWTGNGAHNINDEPMFVNPGWWDPNGTPTNPNDDFWVNGDYRLQPTSHCIDAGDPYYIASPGETDLDGNPRISDGDGDGIAIADMGAYEVLRPIEADIHIVPRTINRRSRTKRIMAIIRLPEGITRRDIADEPFVLEPGGIEAMWDRVIGRGNQATVFALFDKDEVMNALPNTGRVELTVVGKLESGRCISGTDTVRIVRPRSRRASGLRRR